MRIVTSPREMRALSQRARARGLRTGFVPTMGALHEAHLSLARRARQENDRVVVSVFVNPTQFGPREDYARYPRPFREDAAKCRGVRADVLYHPSPAGMYPEGFRSRVVVEGFSEVLCGASRPVHFSGVATVVLKLLQQAAPDALYLGEKDFQQLVILKRMVRDLDLPLRVVGCPILRESDGLAMSSRNRYLSPAERAAAPGLHAALAAGAAAARAGRGVQGAARVMREKLRKIPGSRLDYAAIVDPMTLDTARPGARGTLRALAALYFRNTRLIDNVKIIV